MKHDLMLLQHDVVIDLGRPISNRQLKKFCCVQMILKLESWRDII